MKVFFWLVKIAIMYEWFSFHNSSCYIIQTILKYINACQLYSSSPNIGENTKKSKTKNIECHIEWPFKHLHWYLLWFHALIYGGLHKNWMFSVQTVILVWAVNILIVIMCLGSALPLQKCTVKHYWKQALPSLWNVWYVLAPASDSPQTISWGHLESLDIWPSKLTINWKKHQLCYFL